MTAMADTLDRAEARARAIAKLGDPSAADHEPVGVLVDRALRENA